MKNPFKREVDPLERFFDALEELNEAWQSLPNRRVKPWIDWDRRQIIATQYMDPMPMTIDEAREAMQVRRTENG